MVNFKLNFGHKLISDAGPGSNPTLCLRGGLSKDYCGFLLVNLSKNISMTLGPAIERQALLLITLSLPYHKVYALS